MNGKGSSPRPMSVSRDEYRRRWEETFGGEREDEESSIYLTPQERGKLQDELNRLESKRMLILEQK